MARRLVAVLLAGLGVLSVWSGGCAQIAGVQDIPLVDAGGAACLSFPTSCTPAPCTPPTSPVSIMPAGACTQAELSSAAACAAAADAGPGCASLVSPSCGACLLTPSSGTSWGALLAIESPTSVGASTKTTNVILNVAACVARTAGTQACTDALTEVFSCSLQACVPYCPVASPSDTTGLNALIGYTTSCVQIAETTTCVAASNTATTACGGTNAVVYDACKTLRDAALTSVSGLVTFLTKVCG